MPAVVSQASQRLPGIWHLLGLLALVFCWGWLLSRPGSFICPFQNCAGHFLPVSEKVELLRRRGFCTFSRAGGVSTGLWSLLWLDLPHMFPHQPALLPSGHSTWQCHHEGQGGAADMTPSVASTGTELASAAILFPGLLGLP